jgi:hypothetical protein
MKVVKKGPLSEFLFSRTSLLELIIVAIVISFSVNVISSSITLFQGYKPIVGVIIGIVFCLAALLYLAFRNFDYKEECHIYNGFFVLDEENNKLVYIPRYELGESLPRYMDSVFAENSALKYLWDKEPIRSYIKFDTENNKVIRKEPNSAKLLKEAFEYFILEELSIHLTDYFNDDKFNDKEIHKFERNEIPDILLSNRILELFSKPMEERPMFSEHLTHENPLEEVTIKYYGKNGANYERFDLVLPVNSKVKRINSDQIEIKTNRFKMNIMVDMSGANTLIAEDFEKYYLSIDDFLKVGIYEIHAIVKIKFNLLSIFSIQGWEYYQWIDSFLKRLNECISKDEFIEHINWDSILTFIHCGNVLRTAQEAAPALEKREQNLIE